MITPIETEKETYCADYVKGHPLADKIGGVIAHRIDFPKVLAGKMTRHASLNAKSRPRLTREERDDVRQTVAFVLCATGALERGTLTFGDWKECFRAVRGADCLRIDRQAKNRSEILRIESMTPEQVDVISAKENLRGLSDARRKVIARRMRYLRACFLAFSATDISRQKKHNRRKGVRVLRFLASQFKTTGEGFSEIVDTEKDLSKRVSDCIGFFKERVKKGEEILTAESLAGIPFKKVRTLKTFASLT
jgi:hypothetical protein